MKPINAHLVVKNNKDFITKVIINVNAKKCILMINKMEIVKVIIILFFKKIIINK